MNVEHYSWSIPAFVLAMSLVILAVFIWKMYGKKQSIYEMQHSLHKSGKEAPLLLPDYSRPGKISYQSI